MSGVLQGNLSNGFQNTGPSGPAGGELFGTYPAPGVTHRFTTRWFWNAQILGPITAQDARPGARIVAGTCGETFATAVSLRGIAVMVDVAESAPNVWGIEVVKDPTGTPVLMGSALTLPNDGSTRKASRRDLSAVLAVGEDYGVRIVRTAGGNNSSFTDIMIVVEFSLP